MVQWLGLQTFTAKGAGSAPGWETKIPQSAWWGQKKLKRLQSQEPDDLNSPSTLTMPPVPPLPEQFSLSANIDLYMIWHAMLCYYMGFPGGSAVKNLPKNAGDTRDSGSIPGSERSQEKEMATHSSILVWEIPWTEEPGRLQSMGLQRDRHDWATKYTWCDISYIYIYIYM